MAAVRTPPVVYVLTVRSAEDRARRVHDQLRAMSIEAVFVTSEPRALCSAHAKGNEVGAKVAFALRQCERRGANSSCIVAEDDTVFHPSLLPELALTLRGLRDPQVLHLCPGFAWGRRHRNASLHFHSNTEWSYVRSALRGHRAWPFWPSGSLVGGPIAFWITSRHVATFLRRIPVPYDRPMSRMHLPSHHIANEPQFCYEHSGPGRRGYASAWAPAKNCSVVAAAPTRLTLWTRATP